MINSLNFYHHHDNEKPQYSQSIDSIYGDNQLLSSGVVVENNRYKQNNIIANYNSSITIEQAKENKRKVSGKPPKDSSETFASDYRMSTESLVQRGAVKGAAMSRKWAEQYEDKSSSDMGVPTSAEVATEKSQGGSTAQREDRHSYFIQNSVNNKMQERRGVRPVNYGQIQVQNFLQATPDKITAIQQNPNHPLN